jgi:ribonuclease P protein component
LPSVWPTLNKTEKLKSRKSIQELYRKGKRIYSFPLLLLYIPMDSASEKVVLKMAASVSKKKIRRAVDRNKLKRRIREAYRLQKPEILNILPHQTGYLFMFVYLSKEVVSYHIIENAMEKIVKKLIKSWDA